MGESNLLTGSSGVTMWMRGNAPGDTIQGVTP